MQIYSVAVPINSINMSPTISCNMYLLVIQYMHTNITTTFMSILKCDNRLKILLLFRKSVN